MKSQCSYGMSWKRKRSPCIYGTPREIVLFHPVQMVRHRRHFATAPYFVTGVVRVFCVIIFYETGVPFLYPKQKMDPEESIVRMTHPDDDRVIAWQVRWFSICRFGRPEKRSENSAAIRWERHTRPFVHPIEAPVRRR